MKINKEHKYTYVKNVKYNVMLGKSVEIIRQPLDFPY